MIECLGEGQVTVTAQRIKKGKRADIFHQRTYNAERNKRNMDLWFGRR